MDPSLVQFYYKLTYKIAMVFVLIGALSWGILGLTGINVVERMFGSMSRAVYILVGLIGLVLALNRDTYLPFLGESVLPCSILPEQTPPGATRSVQVHVEPLSKVIYWAAEPTEGHGLVDYVGAYKKYENAGVAIADANGIATLTVREPQSYKVPFKGELNPHIHFRTCTPMGFVSRIKTVFIKDGRVEGFTL